jgi:hypothetical protein
MVFSPRGMLLSKHRTASGDCGAIKPYLSKVLFTIYNLDIVYSKLYEKGSNEFIFISLIWLLWAYSAVFIRILQGLYKSQPHVRDN